MAPLSASANRFRISVLAAAFGLSLVCTGFGVAQDCGDVNGDDSVSAADALAALHAAVGSGPACDFCLCDPDCDRESTASDALEILRAAVGLDDIGCCVIDGCFEDEDCEPNQECTSDPAATCDLICADLVTTTSTTNITLDECFEDEDCEQAGFGTGCECAGFRCVDCDEE